MAALQKDNGPRHLQTERWKGNQDSSGAVQQPSTIKFCWASCNQSAAMSAGSDSIAEEDKKKVAVSFRLFFQMLE